MTQPSGTDQDDLFVDHAAQAEGAAESTDPDGTRPPPEHGDTEVVDPTAEVSAEGSPAIETLTTVVESLREALATMEGSSRRQRRDHRESERCPLGSSRRRRTHP